MDLSLCIIAKDEEENIDACLRSVIGHVDEIVVVDTGSTDRTREVSASHGATVRDFNPSTNPEAFFRDDEATCSAFGAPAPYSGDVMLGDFGAARRRSFELARGDFIVWIDADDVLEGAERLREVIADMRARGLDMGFLAYDYARDDKGRTYYRQWRERVVRRGCASWTNPVHEVLLPSRQVSSARYEGITFIHRRKADRKSVPNRNYKILLRQLAKDRASGTPVDPRTLFYLGQEARWIEPQRSAQFYEEYLGKSGWGEERAAAHIALGSMHEFAQLGATVEEAYARADREYAAAAANMPENPDGLHGMARIAYLRGRHHDCIAYAERAFKIGNTESMLGANPLDRLYRPHVYYNHALAIVGRLEEAIASCRAGLEACPDDPGVPGGGPGMLKHNLAAYEAELARRREGERPAALQPKLVAEFDKNEDPLQPPMANIPRDVLTIYALQLWKQLAHVERDGARARAFLGALPRDVQRDPVASRLVDATARLLPDWPKISVDVTPEVAQSRLVNSDRLSIVFWVGPSVEPWDPNTPNERGIGGSETACAEMARELAARGHAVTVYGDLPPDNRGLAGCDFDGVDYVHWQHAAPPIECDVFISSRAPAVMDDPAKIRAAVKLLWVHDVNVGADSPQMERWLLAFDGVLALSEWHKRYLLWSYPWLDPKRVIVTRNGIDPRRFGGIDDQWMSPPKRNHVITASSPNRGLDVLVVNWPHVRAKVPDAELHVYYGFDCWETFAKLRNDAGELEQIASFKRMLAERAHAGSGIHLHGRVGQRELAQAYLRAKVWSHFTQFTETSCISAMEAQAAGAVPVHSNVAALAETVRHGVAVNSAQAHVDAMVRLLTDEGYRRPIAEAGRRWAFENLSWSGLAAEWDAMFRRVAGELRVDPLPRYVEVGR